MQKTPRNRSSSFPAPCRAKKWTPPIAKNARQINHFSELLWHLFGRLPEILAAPHKPSLAHSLETLWSNPMNLLTPFITLNERRRLRRALALAMAVISWATSLLGLRVAQAQTRARVERRPGAQRKRPDRRELGQRFEPARRAVTWTANCSPPYRTSNLLTNPRTA